VQAATRAGVSFKNSGTLTALDVSVGQHVYAGELLAQQDPGPAELALTSAQTNLQSAVRRNGYNLPAPNFSGTGPVFKATQVKPQ